MKDKNCLNAFNVLELLFPFLVLGLLSLLSGIAVLRLLFCSSAAFFTSLALLLVGFLFGLHFISTLYLYLHERCHIISYSIIWKGLKLLDCHDCWKIKYEGLRFAYATSVLLGIFERSPEHYSVHIRESAAAGTLYTSTLYVILAGVAICLSKFVHHYFLIAATAFVVVAFFGLFEFFASIKKAYREQSTSNQNGQSDAQLILHPETFENIHKYTY